jgi:hypothetical protein
MLIANQRDISIPGSVCTNINTHYVRNLLTINGAPATIFHYTLSCIYTHKYIIPIAALRLSSLARLPTRLLSPTVFPKKKTTTRKQEPNMMGAKQIKGKDGKRW